MRTDVMLIVALLLTPVAMAQDAIFLKDGRYYDVPKIEEQPQSLRVIYRNGNVEVPRHLVRDYVMSGGAGGGYQPQDDVEKAKLDKGLVPFEGDWVPVARRDQILEKRRADKTAAMLDYKSHQEWRNRFQESTAHFNFEYTVPHEVGEDYKEMFEVFYANAAKEWKLKQPTGKKLKVCFYNDVDDFHRIGNVPRGVLGYYRFVEPLELNFFYERRDKMLTLDVLFHELNHYMFDLLCVDNYQMAPWLSEGMSEYYGACRWDPTTKTMMYGQIQEGRLVNLMDEMDGDNFQDLRSLMREYDIDATQYAWSWTLCHMLMENKAYKDKLKKYIEKVAKDKLKREPNPRNMSFQWVPPDEAIALFQKTLGIKDLDAFEQEWYAYIKSLNVQTARGYHEAAMFCKQWNRPVRAAIYFRKAIDDFYSDNPSTYEEYASLLIADDKAKEAIEVLQTGIKLDPMNPYMYKLLGDAHRKLSGDSREQGKRLQLMALEMDPNDLDLYRGLDSEVLAEAGG